MNFTQEGLTGGVYLVPGGTQGIGEAVAMSHDLGVDLASFSFNVVSDQCSASPILTTSPLGHNRSWQTSPSGVGCPR